MSNPCFDASSDPQTYAQEVAEALLKTDFQMLERIAEAILETKKNDATIFTAGNGGSAATASHIINDLTKGCRIHQRNGFKTICLNDSSVLVTCLANDFCYEDVYKILLRTLGKPGDLLIVYSGSGNSPNILRLCEQAREMGILIVAFGGRDGGKMKNLADLCLLAPTDSMEQIEDLHVVYFHSLVCSLKKKLRESWDMEIFTFPGKLAPRRFLLCNSIEEKNVAGREAFCAKVAETESVVVDLSHVDSSAEGANAEGANVLISADPEADCVQNLAGYLVGIAPDDESREKCIQAGAKCLVPDLTNAERLLRLFQK
ncbi:MAG: SIS domain-containing protein [Planctomycetia bacterium]|nr:SIS domain-containing protein [Planctomycetia bacterium]